MEVDIDGAVGIATDIDGSDDEEAVLDGLGDMDGNRLCTIRSISISCNLISYHPQYTAPQSQ